MGEEWVGREESLAAFLFYATGDSIAWRLRCFASPVLLGLNGGRHAYIPFVKIEFPVVFLAIHTCKYGDEVGFFPLNITVRGYYIRFTKNVYIIIKIKYMYGSYQSKG